MEWPGGQLRQAVCRAGMTPAARACHPRTSLSSPPSDSSSSVLGLAILSWVGASGLSVLITVVIAVATTSLQGDKAGLAMVGADLCALAVFAAAVVRVALRASIWPAALVALVCGPTWLMLVFINLVVFNR